MTRKYTECKKGQRNFQPFIENQLVWLEGTNLHLSHPMAKLRPKQFGPFHINKVISPCVYCLNLPKHWKIHNIFHASLLSPYTKTPEHGPNYPEPPPELINDQPEYEVEQVLGFRCTVTFSFFLYTMPLLCIELLYYSRDDWDCLCTRGKAPSGLSHPSTFMHVGHHFLISHAFSIIPTLCYSLIHLPSSAPMAYL
jgi:hypothetical protein